VARQIVAWNEPALAECDTLPRPVRTFQYFKSLQLRCFVGFDVLANRLLYLLHPVNVIGAIR
jgi:hypothetical protein